MGVSWNTATNGGKEMSNGLDVGFVDDIQVSGLSKEDSFRKHFPEECEGKNEEEITALATKKLNKKKNNEYYVARAKQFEMQEKDKAEWNREVFNQKATSLLDSLYKRAMDTNKPNEKLAVLKTITDLMKELNLVNGLQENKITVNVNPIRPVETANVLKTYDENGNIVDADFQEVKNEE